MFSVKFQLEVLKLLAVNKKFSSQFGILLKPDYFDLPHDRVILKIILQYIMQYEEEITENNLSLLIQEYSLKKSFDSEFEDLLFSQCRSIFNTTIKNEQFIIDQISSFIRGQELKNALVKSVDLFQEGKDYEGVLKLINDAVSVGVGVDLGADFSDVLNFPNVYRSRYNPADLIKTTLNKYNSTFQGGLAKGEIHVIQAPPKTGKSTLASNLGVLPIIEGKTVFHATCEIPTVDVLAKYVCRLTGLTYSELLSCSMEEYSVHISKFKQFQPNLFVQYWTEGTASALDIRAWISKVISIRKVKPDLLIIDYDDCLIPSTGHSDGDLYGNSGKIYDELKGVADYFQVPIILFAQTKREAWYKYENTGLVITADEISHSAQKIMKCFSISSMNFKRDNNEGVLYVDYNRRGNSNVYIPLVKDLSKAYFQET